MRGRRASGASPSFSASAIAKGSTSSSGSRASRATSRRHGSSHERSIERVRSTKRVAVRAQIELAELYLTDGGRYRPEKAREYAELASGGGGQRYELLARAYRACGDVDMAAVTLEIGAEDDSLPAENRKRLRAILDVGGGAKPSGSDGVSSRP